MEPAAADGYGIGAQIAERPADERPDFVVGPDRCVGLGRRFGTGQQGHPVPGKYAWPDATATRSLGADGSRSYGSAPGYEIGRKGVQLLMEQIGNKGPDKDQAYPRQLCRAHRHRGHGHRGHQPPRTPVRPGSLAGNAPALPEQLLNPQAATAVASVRIYNAHRSIALGGQPAQKSKRTDHCQARQRAQTWQ